MSNLKICLLRNGLANQVFQYIFARYIEILSGDDVFFDNSGFWRENLHSGYQLENAFPNIKKPKLLSNLFSESVWNKMIERCDEKMVHEQLNDIGINLLFVIEDYLKEYIKGGRHDGTIDGAIHDWVIHNYTGDFFPVPNYIPGFAQLKSNVYFYGYWCNERYFKEIKQQMMNELEFAPLSDEKNIKYAEYILNTNSVAVHVRRSDFVELGLVEGVHYYARSISAISSKISNPVLFMFSDDIEWCKENIDKMAKNNMEVVFIEGNAKEKSHIDMQLMSMCKSMILNKSSSFGSIASMLNKHKNVIVLR